VGTLTDSPILYYLQAFQVDHIDVCTFAVGHEQEGPVPAFERKRYSRGNAGKQQLQHRPAAESVLHARPSGGRNSIKRPSCAAKTGR